MKVPRISPLAISLTGPHLQRMHYVFEAEGRIRPQMGGEVASLRLECPVRFGRKEDKVPRAWNGRTVRNGRASSSTTCALVPGAGAWPHPLSSRLTAPDRSTPVAECTVCASARKPGRPLITVAATAVPRRIRHRECCVRASVRGIRDIRTATHWITRAIAR